MSDGRKAGTAARAVGGERAAELGRALRVIEVASSAGAEARSAHMVHVVLGVPRRKGRVLVAIVKAGPTTE